MGTNQKNLLYIASKCSRKELVDYVDENNKSEQLKDRLAELTNEEFEQFYLEMTEIVRKVVLYSFGEKDLNLEKKSDPSLISSEDMEKLACEEISANISLLREAMELENSRTCYPLRETFLLLHTLIDCEEPFLSVVKPEIAIISEAWCTKKLEGFEGIYAKTLLYFLNKSLISKTNKDDIKRVCNFSESLQTIDLANPDNAEIVSLFKKCFLSQQFLNFPTAHKFLVALLNLSPEFTEDIHINIKNNMPIKQINRLSEVYYKAWQNSSEEMKDKIKCDCIQDIMYAAIHVNPMKSKDISTNLFRFLKHFHANKNKPEVRDLLWDLYGPLIWRSTKAANPLVRQNAVQILVDVFPLESSNLSRKEQDENMQRQFQLFIELLRDKVAAVRVKSVIGISKVCCLYWDVIPRTVLKEILDILLKELIHDRSSADVRSSVLKGLEHLLKNEHSHQILKSALPQIKNSFHDVSEKVRVQFLNLLIAIKKLKTFRFWDIVEPDHLHARLEDETSDPVAKRITELLTDTYFPVDKKDDFLLLMRTISLLKIGIVCARNFYTHLRKICAFEHCTHLITVILSAMRNYFKKHLEQLNESNLSDQQEKENRSGKHKPRKEPWQSQDDSKLEPDSCKNLELPLDNPETLRGLVEIASIVWTSIEAELTKPSNEACKTKLQAKAGKLAVLMFKCSLNAQTMECLYYLASFLPWADIPMISGHCMSILRNLKPPVKEEEYSTILECLWKWDKIGDVCELISDWLNEGVELPKPQENGEATECVARSTRKKNKASKKVRFAEERKPQPLIALKLMTSMLLSQRFRSKMMSKHRNLVMDIWKRLHSFVTLIEQRINAKGAIEAASDKFLLSSFTLMNKISPFLHSIDGDLPYDSVQAYCETLTWAISIFLPALNEESTREIDTGSTKFLMDFTACLLEISFNYFIIDYISQIACYKLFQFLLPVMEIFCREEKILNRVGEVLLKSVQWTIVRGTIQTDENDEQTLQEVMISIVAKFVSILSSTTKAGIDVSHIMKMLQKELHCYEMFSTVFEQQMESSTEDTLSAENFNSFSIL